MESLYLLRRFELNGLPKRVGRDTNILFKCEKMGCWNFSIQLIDWNSLSDQRSTVTYENWLLNPITKFDLDFQNRAIPGRSPMHTCHIVRVRCHSRSRYFTHTMPKKLATILRK